MKIIDEALKQNRTALSEYESKLVLASYGLPVTREKLIGTPEELEKAAVELGYPLVLKGCSADLAHKTEKGLIRLDIRNAAEAMAAFEEIMAGMNGSGGGVLVQQMIRGQRELVLGLTRDPQFGPCVMFGLGGIFSELQADVGFALAPLNRSAALKLIERLGARRLLEGFRGRAPLNKELMAETLVSLGHLGTTNPQIEQIDINPMAVVDGSPVAVDATVILKPSSPGLV